MVFVDQVQLVQDLVGARLLLGVQLLDVELQFLGLEDLDTDQEGRLFGSDEEAALLVCDVEHHVVSLEVGEDRSVGRGRQRLVHLLQVVAQELLFVVALQDSHGDVCEVADEGRCRHEGALEVLLKVGLLARRGDEALVVVELDGSMANLLLVGAELEVEDREDAIDVQEMLVLVHVKYLSLWITVVIVLVM